MNKPTIVFTLLFLVSTFSVSAQSKNGFWDKDRATTKEIVVSARDRIVVKTEDLPLGTTEIVYRITLLSENQEMASSLVSVLKSIPDPSGISQGSAGAVFLLSKVSGDDKCKYAIFSSEKASSDYVGSGETTRACLFQNNPVNKDAKRISIGKTTCFNADSEALWFAFESKNWIMNQKIVLEVVPWVDAKLSRGWSKENKKSVIDLCKSSDFAQLMVNSDDFCICVLDKFEKENTFKEFQDMLAIEKSKDFKDYGNACLTEKPNNKTILNGIRKDAATHFKNKKYNDAIDMLNIGVIDNGNASILDYNSLATYYLYSKQYDKALKAINKGIELDDSELRLQLNLAHYYMLTNQFGKAKTLHKKYQSQNITAKTSWKAQAKTDIHEFKKAGIQSDDLDKVLEILGK